MSEPEAPALSDFSGGTTKPLFEQYSEYKLSGVDWLGRIPKHWETTKLKGILRLQYGDSLKSDERDKEGDIPVYGSNGINDYHDTPNTESPVVILGRKGSYGKVNFSECRAFAIDTTYYIDSTVTSENLRWLYYLLTAMRLDSFSEDSAVPGLSRRYAEQFQIPDIPQIEQKAIANFIDREVSKIDKLIYKKELLIGLLEEKRVAIIKNAVSNGINFSVRREDSGVEWLGDIPDHWEVRELRYFADIDTGDKDTKDAVKDGEYPFFVRSQTEERINSYSFDGEAVLTAGDGVGVGEVFHYIDGKFDYHQRVYMISNFDEDIDGKYLYYYLKANLKMEIFKNNAKSTVDSLRMPMFKSFPVAFGDIDEQQEIVRYLDTQNKQIENLIQKVKEGIERLEEYRDALIIEAVTGQIDVRGEV